MYLQVDFDGVIGNLIGTTEVQGPRRWDSHTFKEDSRCPRNKHLRYSVVDS